MESVIITVVTIYGEVAGTLAYADSIENAMAEAISVMDPFQNIQAWKEAEQNWN